MYGFFTKFKALQCTAHFSDGFAAHISRLLTLLSLKFCRGVPQQKPVYSFYPTALKGCQGIVFTHGVQMGGWVGGKKFVRAVSQKP